MNTRRSARRGARVGDVAEAAQAEPQPGTGAEAVLGAAVGGMRMLSQLFQENPGLSQAVNAHPPLAALAAVGEALSLKSGRDGPSFSPPASARAPETDAPFARLQDNADAYKEAERRDVYHRPTAHKARERRIALSTDATALQAKFDEAQRGIEAEKRAGGSASQTTSRTTFWPSLTPVPADAPRRLGALPREAEVVRVYNSRRSSRTGLAGGYAAPFPRQKPFEPVQIWGRPRSQDPLGLSQILSGVAGDVLLHNQRVEQRREQTSGAQGGDDAKAPTRPQVGKVEFVLTAKTTDREIDELTDRTPAEREALKRERDRLRAEGGGDRELSLFDEYVVEKGLEPVMNAYDLDSEQMFRVMNSLPDRRRERLEKLFAQGKRPTKGRRGTFTHMLALHELEEQMKALGLRHEGGGSLDEVRRKHGSVYGYTDADFLDPSEGLHGVEVEVRDQYGNFSPHAATSEAKKSGSGIYRDRMTFEVKRRGSDKE